MAKTSSSGKKFVPSAVSEDLIPAVNNAYDLGSSAKKWAQLAVVLAVIGTLTVTTLTATDINVIDLNITNITDDFSITGNKMYLDNGTDTNYIYWNGSAVIIHAE